MKSIHQLLRKTRRLWMLEHFARSGLLVIGLAVNAVLLCWLLHRLFGLPASSVYVVAGLAAIAMGVLGGMAQMKAPTLQALAQSLDERAGTEDIFTSALEFHDQPARFGWLGQQTVMQATANAASVNLSPRLSVGRLRNWSALGALAAVLAISSITVGYVQDHRSSEAPVAESHPSTHTVVAATNEEPPKPAEKAVAETPPVLPPEPETQPDEKPNDQTVKITNEMVEKYLDTMTDEKVDLTGVTPIRWDQDEASGKDNPQDKAHEGEKIDPVKLDAALLKDLQVAKKTKDESGGNKEGGVDIAVMGKTGDLKAKGDQGGKKDKESLADAVSKDPRGDPTRMAVRPPARALPIRSVEKLPTREKGEDRPMSPLDFAGALERMKSQPPEIVSTAVKPLDHPEDHVVRQEGVAEPAAELTESYFDLLRKADR